MKTRRTRFLPAFFLFCSFLLPTFIAGDDEVKELVDTTEETLQTELNLDGKIPDLVLSIDEIAERAVAASPALKQATHISESYRGAYIQAGLQNNPVIAVGNEEMDRYDRAGIQTMALAQERISSKKRSARQYAVRQEQQVAQTLVSVQEQRVRNDARLAGLRLMVAQQMVTFYQGLFNVCEKAAKTTRKLVVSGDVSRAELLEADVERNRAKVSLENAKIELISASNAVALFIGEPKGRHIKVSDTFVELPPALNEEALLEDLIENSPQLQQARAEVSAAQAQLVSACREAGVDITPVGVIRYVNEKSLMDFSVGVEVPLRIHNRNQGNIQTAQYLLRAAQSNLERIEQGLRTEFEKSFTEYQMAEHVVRDYQISILDETNESYDMVYASYQAGEVSYIDLLAALIVLYDVQLEYIDHVRTLFNSHALLTGFLLEGAYEKPE